MTSDLLWLPAAIRDEHDRAFPWQETTDPKGCLHTTEGSGWPGYQGWTVMPHGTVLPTPGKGVTIRQHLPLDQASFSLRHTRPQPTGGDYVWQWELIGTSAKGGPGYYWPGADDAVLLDLWHKLIHPLSVAKGIPLRALPFLAFPYPAGANRLTDAQYDRYTGWLGHQHVPQNDHGDPGAFPWDRMVALAARQTEDTDMTPAQIAQLVKDTAEATAEAVWQHRISDAYHGDERAAASVLSSGTYYATSGGLDGAIPTAAQSGPGQPTSLRSLLTRLDEVHQGVKDLRDALAAKGIE